MEDSYTIRGLLSRIRTEESRRIKEVSSLNFQLQKLKQRYQKVETEAKLADDKRKYKEGEVAHLKLALERRDEIVSNLEKHLDNIEKNHVPIETLEKSEGTRVPYHPNEAPGFAGNNDCMVDKRVFAFHTAARERSCRSRLIEKESQCSHMLTKLNNYKNDLEAIKREKMIVQAKYQQLLQSESAAQDRVHHLLGRISKLESVIQERDTILYNNLANSENQEIVDRLLALGREIQADDEPTSSSTCDGNDYFDSFSLHDKQSSNGSEAISL